MQPGQMEETGSEQKQPGQTQSNQVTDHIELTSPLVKGTGAGNEEPHDKKYSRRQETENELEEKWKLMRECKMFLEENSGPWQRKTE